MQGPPNAQNLRLCKNIIADARGRARARALARRPEAEAEAEADGGAAGPLSLSWSIALVADATPPSPPVSARLRNGETKG